MLKSIKARIYSFPIRLVSIYILPAKERILLGRFQPDSFKTERLVCVETDALLLIWFVMELALFPSFFSAILLPGQFDALWPSCSHL